MNKHTIMENNKKVLSGINNAIQNLTNVQKTCTGETLEAVNNALDSLHKAYSSLATMQVNLSISNRNDSDNRLIEKMVNNTLSLCENSTNIDEHNDEELEVEPFAV